MHLCCNAHRREKTATADFKMATRERSRVKDRSKASDLSGEHSQGTIGQGRSNALQRNQSIGRSAFVTAPSATLATAPSATQATAPSAAQATASSAVPAAPPASACQTQCSAAADLLVAAAAAVNRAAALQQAEPDTYANSDLHTAASAANANAAASVCAEPYAKEKAYVHAERAAAAAAQLTNSGQGSRRVKHKVCFMSWPCLECCNISCLCPVRLEVKGCKSGLALGCHRLLRLGRKPQQLPQRMCTNTVVLAAA